MQDLTRRGVLLAAAAAGAAPGLLGPQAVQGQTAAQPPAPKRGGTLTTLLTPEPPILVLGVNNQGPTQLAAGKIYQGLCKYSFKLEPLPELATSWTLSDDKKTYTFWL
jgi:peptide/nickel transport system substrate-binding protein